MHEIIDFFYNYGYRTDYHITLDGFHIDRTYKAIENNNNAEVFETIETDEVINIILTSAYVITISKSVQRVISFVMPSITQMRRIYGTYMLPQAIYNIIDSHYVNGRLQWC